MEENKEKINRLRENGKRKKIETTQEKLENIMKMEGKNWRKLRKWRKNWRKLRKCRKIGKIYKNGGKLEKIKIIEVNCTKFRKCRKKWRIL